MDSNCNIITEILLVISYTTSYCKKYIITVTKLLVTSNCPTLLTNVKDHISTYTNTKESAFLKSPSHACIFALSLCQTLCIHGKCHAFWLISLTTRKIRFAPLPHVFAHWHIFPSIALCHSIEFQMHLSIWVPSDVCRRTFFCHIHSHAQNWIQVRPQSVPFIPFLSTLPLIFLLSLPSFSHCHHIFSTFLFQLFFFGLQEGKKHGERKWQRHRDREKKSQESAGRDCRLGTLSMMALYKVVSASVCLSATDSVRRGSEWI